MRIAGMGQAVFAAILIGLGTMGLIKGDFVPIWEPVAKGVPARETLAYYCALVSLLCGVGLLWRRVAAAAARVLLASLLLWLLVFRLPVLLRAATAMATWEGCAETVVILAAAWVLYGGLAADWDRRHLGSCSGDKGVRIGQRLYGLAMLPFGLAHFAYLEETAALVPAWLPGHQAWVWITGSAYLAAGVAILANVLPRLAAALSAVQMGLFTALVWLPIVAAPGPKQAFQWSETLISAALTAAGWVVADSFRGRGWLKGKPPA